MSGVDDDDSDSVASSVASSVKSSVEEEEEVEVLEWEYYQSKEGDNKHFKTIVQLPDMCILSHLIRAMITF